MRKLSLHVVYPVTSISIAFVNLLSTWLAESMLINYWRSHAMQPILDLNDSCAQIHLEHVESDLSSNFQISITELELLSRTSQSRFTTVYAINMSSLAYCRNVSLRGAAVADYKMLRFKVSDLKWPELPVCTVWQSWRTEWNKATDEAVIHVKPWLLLTPREGFHAKISCFFYLGKNKFKCLVEMFSVIVVSYLAILLVFTHMRNQVWLWVKLGCKYR